jgi:mono/diheme cytochrome c family protein
VRLRFAPLATAAALTAVAVAGCGGGSTATGENPGDGKLIFTDSCGGCHTLAAANTSGGAGPELTKLMVGSDTVAAKVRSGGGGMPSFSGDLTEQQIAAVSKFVAENDGSGEGDSSGEKP